MGQADVLDVWKFSTMASGARFVTTTGTCTTLTWYAGSCTVGMPSQPLSRPSSVEVKASFCWMMWTVQEKRVFWDSVLTPAGPSITVVLEKMPASSAQVMVTSPSKGAHLIIQLHQHESHINVFTYVITGHL